MSISSGASRKPRVPQLRYTESRGIGWHVSYRDPKTGTPRKHRFGRIDEAQARIQYHAWVAAHLGGEATMGSAKTANGTHPVRTRDPRCTPPSTPKVTVPGCLAEIATSLQRAEAARVRPEGTPRSPGTITAKLFHERSKHIREFLVFLNDRHGDGAVGRMLLADLSMEDVEAYNRWLARDRGLSRSRISGRLQVVKAIIDRAGRPDLGQQTLGWNWDSRDVLQGKPHEPRQLPTLAQLKKVLNACELRERTIVWLAIGLGLGQRDLAAVRVGQIDAEGYDLRRGKTGIDRYGQTPPLIWTLIEQYLAESKRPVGELMFVTRNGLPLVHGGTDAISQWWQKLRQRIGEDRTTLDGFYVLRHLGATEYGSRPGCSISAMKRWLGHAASSAVADVYMKPVPPEHRELIEWVREELQQAIKSPM